MFMIFKRIWFIIKWRATHRNECECRQKERRFYRDLTAWEKVNRYVD